jgi:outer membrane protein assembly factor BamB
VFVTGGIRGRKTGYEYATIAYNSATGKRLWVRLYNGAGGGDDVAYSMAVSPTGTSVFVTGASGSDYATIAYSAATGRQLWAKLYSTAGNTAEEAGQTAVSVARNIVYVTGGNGPGAGSVLSARPPPIRWSLTTTGPGCT